MGSPLLDSIALLGVRITGGFLATITAGEDRVVFLVLF